MAWIGCTEDRPPFCRVQSAMPWRRRQVLLLACSLVHVAGQTPCPVNSVGGGDGSLCVCRPPYDGRITYTPPTYEGSCTYEDEGGTELAVVVGVVCSVMLAVILVVVVYRTASTRSLSRSRGRSRRDDTPPPPTPTTTRSSRKIDSAAPIATRMVLSHDGVRTITRQRSVSPTQSSQTQTQRQTEKETKTETHTGGQSGRLEDAMPPSQSAQTAAAASGTARALESAGNAQRCGSGRRRVRRNSFEHDEPGLRRLQQALGMSNVTTADLERDRERDAQRETQRHREKEKQTERDRESDRERERQRDTARDTRLEEGTPPDTVRRKLQQHSA